MTGIARKASTTVALNPLCGLFNQSKHIPLRWGGIILEFEVVGTATDVIVDKVFGATFGATSTSWSLTDVRILADVVTLDSALQNSYASHVLSGNTLPIDYNTFITMQQAVSGINVTVNISRAVSILKTLYFSLYGGDPA